MKVVFALLITIYVVFVTCEHCPNGDVASECTHLNCGATFHPDCVSGICTCTANRNCTVQADCNALSGCDRTWHCIDNGCRCGGSFPFPGGR